MVKKRKNITITIDGPAGSGKSTLAKDLAKKLDFFYLNTGLMYRAMTLNVLEKKKSVESESDCLDVLNEMFFSLEKEKNELSELLLNGRKISHLVKTELVDKNVSIASKHKGVRKLMVEKQRSLAENKNIIVEGRDAGSVVFPDADVKLFVVASVEARAKRRYEEYLRKGMDVDYNEILDDMKKRDFLDSHRKNSPLVKPEGAIEIDTSNLTVESQLELALKIIKERINA